MSMSDTFDVLAYLQAELPGFEFRERSTPGLPVQAVQASATLRLGVQGDYDLVSFPVPDRVLAQKHWADEIIKTARADASRQLGLDKVWAERERALIEARDRDVARVQALADARVAQEVGKAYLAGKRAGRAEEMAFASGEEDDE